MGVVVLAWLSFCCVIFGHERFYYHRDGKGFVLCGRCGRTLRG